MSTLAIVLPLAGEAVPSWSFALGDAGPAAPQHGDVPITLLPRVDPAVQVVAVVPAAALSWHRVELPQGITMRSPRLRPVLEGLLEDRLLDDPQGLHLAVEPERRPGSTAWVAVCDKGWLRQRLQELDAAGTSAARVVPEFEPTGDLTLNVTGMPGDAVLIATGGDGVLRLPLNMLAPTTLVRWDAAPLIAEPALAEDAERLLGRSAVLLPAADRLLRAAASRWELAQGDFAQTLQSRRRKSLASAWTRIRRAPEWRLARWGAALVLATNLVGLNAMAWKERSALERKRGEVRAVLTETFPAVRVVVDPALQMQREMALLRQDSGALGEGDLEPVLEAVALASPPGQQPAAIEFSGGETRIKGLSSVAEAMPALQARGLQMRTEAGTLTLRRPSSR